MKGEGSRLELYCCTRPSLGTQSRYKAPGDPRVEYVRAQRLTSGERGCLLVVAQK